MPNINICLISLAEFDQFSRYNANLIGLL